MNCLSRCGLVRLIHQQRPGPFTLQIIHVKQFILLLVLCWFVNLRVLVSLVDWLVRVVLELVFYGVHSFRVCVLVINLTVANKAIQSWNPGLHLRTSRPSHLIDLDGVLRWLLTLVTCIDPPGIKGVILHGIGDKPSRIIIYADSFLTDVVPGFDECLPIVLLAIQVHE